MPKQKSMDMCVSGDQLHIATVLPTGSRQKVYYDGKPGPEFDEIAHFAAGRGHPAIVLSNDGSRIAYLARRGRNSILFADGKEIPVSHPAIPGSFTTDPDQFGFSPDGKHFAYFSKGDDGLFHLIFDGKPGSGSDSIVPPIVFSEQAGHYAYRAKDQGGAIRVVTDGTPGPVMYTVERIQFSPDGKHLTYWANTGHQSGVVLDGVLGPAYADIAMDTIQFSNNNRLGYVAHKAASERERSLSVAVVDGKESEPCMHIDQFTFSHDGRRVAYVASTPDGQSVVVDGKPGRNYDTIYSLDFSPDGSHVAYVGNTASGQFVVIDEEESAPYNSASHLLFSENGKLHAYTASKENGRVVIVVDGHESKPYHQFISMVLSPDGSRYAYEADTSIYKSEITIDGRTAPAQNLVATLEQGELKGKQVFRFSSDSKHLAMASVVSGGGKYVVTVDGAAGPTTGWCARFVFSPDSAHFAYVAYDNPTTSIVLDRKVVQKPTLLVDLQQLPTLPAAFQFREDGRLKYLTIDHDRIVRVSVAPGASLATNTVPPQLGNSTRSAPSANLVTSRKMPGASTQNASATTPPESSAGASASADPSSIGQSLVQALSDGDVDGLTSMYADSVDYLDNGRVSVATVQDHLQEYFAQWPERQWKLAGPVKIESLGASVQQVVFSARYDLHNPETNRRASGVARETLMLAADATGALKIVSHREKIDSRRDTTSRENKVERRRGHERIYQGQPVGPSVPVPLPWPFGRP